MIFRTKLFSATWDTWMYYYNKIYYLYYLITENSCGEGYGVATSSDGVHFIDYGKVLGASDKMVFYLGTGSVWKWHAPDHKDTFICNYSEWRQCGDEIQQSILFAVSKDLIHWEKYGDKNIFLPDSTYYKEFQSQGERWDCIFPLQQEDGGYYGYWTAAPKEFVGVGFGRSQNGIDWEALPPPHMELGMFSESREVEAGAACVNDGKVYLMTGSYGHEKGVGFYVADRPEGPFAPMMKNFALFSNHSHMHAYFSRFFYGDDELLTNFHVIAREENDFGRPITYLAPVKKVSFDQEGILRLMWWEKNAALKGDSCTDIKGDCYIEGSMPIGVPIVLAMHCGGHIRITLDRYGHADYENDASGSYKTEESYDRELSLSDDVPIRMLVSGTFSELYADNHFIGCYTMPGIVIGAEHSLIDVKVWSLSLT